ADPPLLVQHPAGELRELGLEPFDHLADGVARELEPAVPADEITQRRPEADLDHGHHYWTEGHGGRTPNSGREGALAGPRAQPLEVLGPRTRQRNRVGQLRHDALGRELRVRGEGAA